MRKDDLRKQTRLELLEVAKSLQIRGRNAMSKEELVEAIAAAGRASGSKEEPKPPATARDAASRAEGAAGRPGADDRAGLADRPSAGEPPRAAESPGAESRPTAGKRPGPDRGAADDEDEDEQNWNSTALGRDPNYGRFLSPGSIPPRPGAPQRRAGPADGQPRHRGDSLSDRSERGRMRAVERSYGAREELRRTGDARRTSGYTPRYQRPEDARGDRSGRGRVDAPRGGRDTRDPRDPRGEGGRPRGEGRPGSDRRPFERGSRDARADLRRSPGAGGVRAGAPGSILDEGEGGVESRAEMILEAPRVPANAGAPAVRPATAGSGAPVSLPRHYGIDRCRLMVRDPQCIHAYWEIRPETMDRARGDLGDDWEGTRRILRVHGIPISGDTTDPPADSFDLDLEEDASNCYVPIPRPNRGYRVDVGLLTRAGLFYPLASSNTVIAPRNGGSPNRTERWVPPPAAARGGEQAQSAVVHRPLASGPETPPSEPAAAGALREDFSGAGRLAEGLAGAALFESGRGLIPPGPGIPPAAVAPSSPAGAIGAAAQHREAEFRFVLDTELVVYGATEPGAKVTLQGKPVRLRSDGTFSLRFQLPDGEQVLRAEAVSADGRFVRVITPEIRRRTTSEERTEEAGREVETSGDPSDDPGAAGYRKDDTERNGERED